MKELRKRPTEGPAHRALRERLTEVNTSLQQDMDKLDRQRDLFKASQQDPAELRKATAELRSIMSAAAEALSRQVRRPHADVFAKLVDEVLCELQASALAKGGDILAAVRRAQTRVEREYRQT